ncbi:polyamine transporter tpo5 [Cladophialophora chaetospira]|uniref:Polyamine transporter tpo5 n=1 Tax=Cladophialophora chaetospira TaxID=386627 RepID=A0AA38XBF4_9EURO|nr:polyamine transporter tpo5 [Cladophialophora chaetospira]
MADTENAATRSMSKDEGRLRELGYKQELKRDWSLMHNFGVSFSIISVITGITTLFAYGLNTGGPGVMSVGWLIVSFFTMFVGLGMAEIVSAIPSAGGPYFWAAILAPKKWAPFASWVTGWFNLLGQVAVTTGITFGCAGLISTLATINGYEATAGKTLGIYAAILCSHGIVNSFGVHILRYLNNTSIVLHSLGVFSFAVAVVAKAPHHQSAKFVFATFYDGTGDPGWSVRASPAYVACIGILMSQYTITGFDASAHLSEETQNASWSAPIGVLMSIGCSAVFGWFLILCLLFSIQDFDATAVPDAGNPVLQILVDVFGKDSAIVLFVLIIVCVWHCGLFSLTSNSRMMFSFARDGGIPHFFHKVDARFRAPIRTIWLAAFLAFLLAVPSVGSIVAFQAATSIATIGLYISYGLPILIGMVNPEGFIHGPFNLRWFSRPVALIACLWIAFITIIFCLPELNPVDSQSLNYTPVAVGIIAFWCMASWFLWAKRWFKGPIRMVEAEVAGVNVDDPDALDRAEREAKIPHLEAAPGAEKSLLAAMKQDHN